MTHIKKYLFAGFPVVISGQIQILIYSRIPDIKRPDIRSSPTLYLIFIHCDATYEKIQFAGFPVVISGQILILIYGRIPVMIRPDIRSSPTL